jgi:hypothetical protein
VDAFGAGPDAAYARRVLRHGIGDAVVPAVVGGPWTWVPDFLTPAAAPPTVLRWIALAVVAALVAAACRHRAGRRAWLVLALYLLVEIGLLLAGRAAFPALISQQYRYYADSALLVALAVGSTFLAPVPADRPIAGAAVDGRAPDRHRLGAALAAAVAVNLLVVGSLYSAGSFARLWRGNPSSTFVEQSVRSLQAHPGLEVLDRDVPDTVMWALYEDRKASMLFRRVHERARFTTSPTRLVVLDDEGLLRRGDVAGVTTRPGPEAGCGWRVGAGSTRSVPLQIPVYRWQFTLALRYAVPTGTRVRVALDGDGRTWRLDPDAATRYLPVQGGGRLLHLTNLGSADLCVRSATVGLAVAAPGEPL